MRWSIKFPPVIRAQWPAPKSIKTLISTRTGGVSKAPFAELNLGSHVGDQQQSVDKNRELLASLLPNEPRWLSQVHGVDVADTRSLSGDLTPIADGTYSDLLNEVCCVMTADCLPVLMCNAQGTQVAAVHAGWRGLLGGILEVAVSKFDKEDALLVYLGPAIGPGAFEVGPEVRDGFISENIECEVAFKPSSNEGKWLADIYQLAKIRLKLTGVNDIFGGDYCTYSDQERFFSYRRDGQTGRMASCIWIEGLSG